MIDMQQKTFGNQAQRHGWHRDFLEHEAQRNAPRPAPREAEDPDLFTDPPRRLGQSSRKAEYYAQRASAGLIVAEAIRL